MIRRGQKRCNDGFCRHNCSKMEFSNCPADKPLMCGDGRCVQYELECVHPSCPLRQPFLCPDMSCAAFMKECRNSMAFRPFKPIDVVFMIGGSSSNVGIDIQGKEEAEKTTSLFTMRATYDIFYPQKNGPFESKIANMSKEKAREVHLKVESLAFSQVHKSLNHLRTRRIAILDRRFPVYRMTLPSTFTIRSPILNISTKNRFDDNEFFYKPLKAIFKFNSIKIERQEKLDNHKRAGYICLGLLYTQPDGSQTWSCASRKIHNYWDPAFPTPQQKTSQVEFSIPGPGVYAVIVRPDLHRTQANDLVTPNICGFMCNHKLDMVIFLLISIPLFFWATMGLNYL